VTAVEGAPAPRAHGVACGRYAIAAVIVSVLVASPYAAGPTGAERTLLAARNQLGNASSTILRPREGAGAFTR
jgi:hypothetical protein